MLVPYLVSKWIYVVCGTNPLYFTLEKRKQKPLWVNKDEFSGFTDGTYGQLMQMNHGNTNGSQHLPNTLSL
jgi:hypothetical protein